MRQRIGVVAAWIVATAISVLIASNAVAIVQDEVTESPSPLQGQAVQRLAASTTLPPAASPVPSSTSPAPAPTSTTTVPVATTMVATTVPAGSSTTTSAPAPTTTTITTPVAPSTTAAVAGEFRSYELVGGSVRIRVQGDEVVFEGATPAPGYAVEVEEAGPEKVVVEFESPGHESKFTARVEDGELVVKIDEEGEDS